jgi:DUF4097 and DUF4098 domain-containing protein YvlB
MKTFLNALKNELLLSGFASREVDDILKDYEEMISQAIRQGLSENAIEDTFGTVKQIVLEIKSDHQPKHLEDIGEEVQTFNLDEIKDIDIDLVNEDIKLLTHQENYFKLTYDGIFDKNHILIEVDNQTLVIKNKKKYHGLKKERNKLSFYIYVPKLVRLNQVAVGSINGEIAILNITGNQLKAYSVNGLTKLSENEFLEIKFDGVNSKTWIQKNFSDVLNAKTVSGKLIIEKNDINETLNISTVSAHVQLSQTMPQQLKVNTVNGHVTCLEVYPYQTSLNTVSGNITFENKDKTKIIQIDHKRSITGKIIIK